MFHEKILIACLTRRPVYRIRSRHHDQAIATGQTEQCCANHFEKSVVKTKYCAVMCLKQTYICVLQVY